jgi:hypothetical protein
MSSINVLVPALATNSTNTTFAAKIPTTTVPSGNGFFDLSDRPYGQTSSSPSYIHLLPFGTAANNKTFDMRLWGYAKTGDATPLYVPFIIADLSITLGNIDASAIAASTFLADTIVLNKGIPAGQFSGLLNTANDSPGSIVLHLLGAKYIFFDFDADAGGAASTDANCYWRLLSLH